MTGTVLHFAPHPDDELLGAPATLMALRDAGYRIVNVAWSLGRPEDQERRRRELEQASQRAGFEFDIPEPPLALSSIEDHAATEAEIIGLTRDRIGSYSPVVVVGPSPHDRQPAHELVGRAMRAALEGDSGGSLRWWMWAIWGPLPLPTLATSFSETRMLEITAALEAHAGELERNDYARLLHGRAEMNGVLAPELLRGFGAEAQEEDAPFVELLTEVSFDNGWRLGDPRRFDPAAPFGGSYSVDVSEWLAGPSLTARYGLATTQRQHRGSA